MAITVELKQQVCCAYVIAYVCVCMCVCVVLYKPLSAYIQLDQAGYLLRDPLGVLTPQG